MSTAKTAARKLPQGSLRETPQERKEREFLQAKLDAALASGPAVEMTDEDWEELAAGTHAEAGKVVARK